MTSQSKLVAIAAFWLTVAPAITGNAQVRVPTQPKMQSDLGKNRQLADASKPRTAEERIAKARVILEDSLVDYSRAKVRGMYVTETVADKDAKLFLGIPVGAKFIVICGEINAPNRMGGMTGWQDAAIIVEGRDFAPLVYGGRYALSEHKAACPTGSVGEDVTAALQPAAKPAD